MAGKKVRSIKGDIVDFDLMKIKQNMEQRDKPDSVELREKYIDIRRRRNPRRNVSDLVNEQRQNQNDAREGIERSKRERLEREKAEQDTEAVETVETVETETVETVETVEAESVNDEPDATPDVTKARSPRKKL